METLLYPILVIGGIGAVSALGLGIAAKVFAVYVDPKIIEFEEVLPGANCGGCGFTGCSAAATALSKGKALPNLCVAGGTEVAEAIGIILGISVGSGEKALAELGCKYSKTTSHMLFDYKGISDCKAAHLVAGGGKVCDMGCLGFGSCVDACQFYALEIGKDGLPEVNKDLCVGCGACERACPKNIIRVNTPSRRFLHQQTDMDCVAPCQATCPAQIDIPKYIKQVADGNYEEAVMTIKEYNPFPLVCGRVCPHVCESVCRRADVDEPVNINHIKRFAADYEMLSGKRIMPQVLSATGKKVAIIGAGPSGLTCAFYLARLGHQCKVFEEMPKPGGMLLYGIPEYRLPKKILDWEIKGILGLGVELECDSKFGKDFTAESLQEEGYDAIYMAVGAWDSRKLGVTGENDYCEVASGTDFLIKRGLGEETPVGDNVIIVGGGNTAMDCARTSWRLGAKNVYLLYRRSRNEMPANDIEVVEGDHEEVQYRFLAAPTKLVGQSGKLKGMEYLKMELGAPDASGRRRPVPVEGSEEIITASNVFSAIGQSPNLACIDDGIGKNIKRTRWNSVLVNEATGETSVNGIFAGGDGARGAATAVESIRDGRFAAKSIHSYLSGEDIITDAGFYDRAPKLRGVEDGFEKLPAPSKRAIMPDLTVEERRLNFTEVELGFSEETAKAEANRCLQCGVVCYKGHREKA